MKILVIDVGGTHVKVLATGRKQRAEFPSGPKMTPAKMVAAVRAATAGWTYDAVSIGYPGPVAHGRPLAEPHNLGRLGWIRFQTGVWRPSRQDHQRRGDAGAGKLQGRAHALSWSGHRAGLGADRGRRARADGTGAPALQEGPDVRRLCRAGRAQAVGKKEMAPPRGQDRQLLQTALQADYVVFGGGNARLLKKLPPGARLGDNANAFRGGFRLWSRTLTPARHANGSTISPCHGSLQDARAARESYSCSTWTTRCSTTTGSSRTSSTISKARSAPGGRGAIGRFSSSCEPSLATPIISAPCSAYRREYPHDLGLLAVSRFLIDYPFANRLFPNSLDVLEHVRQWGTAVLLSDGDVVFQPRKVERSGLFEAVDGHVLIYVHKERELADVEATVSRPNNT